MKLNKRRQFAQAALFSLAALCVSTAFAQGIPNMSATDSSKATGKAIVVGQGESGDAKGLASSGPCQCKVVHQGPEFFLSQDMPTGTSANTDNSCRSACTSVVTNPSVGTQLGTTVISYLQNKCSNIHLKVYGKKAGNNYGGQTPDLVTKQGTGTSVPPVPAHCGPALGPVTNLSLNTMQCTNEVTGIAIACPAGTWTEHSYPGQPGVRTCVNQACASGSQPGAQNWFTIGASVNGGLYLTDNAGGSRFFVKATTTCPSGYTYTGTGVVCRKTWAAVPAVPGYCQ